TSSNGKLSKSKAKEYKEKCTHALEVLQNPEISEQEKNAVLKSLIKKAVYDRHNQLLEVFYL
ncbi:MAG: hypothetical protein IJX15_05110, partial [Ruminiclostridium sp.]|nr:hypothetical protein [Ruminiclostridium sp.]